MNKLLVAVVALGVLSLAPVAAADTPIHLKTTATCTTQGGSTVTLPAGYFLSEDLWERLDRETRRLQELETRLSAENKSLKESLKKRSKPLTLLSGAILGITAGRLLF